MFNKKIFVVLLLILSTLTITAVSAESLTVKSTSEDSKICWEFTGTENQDYKAGYEFALISKADGQVYYLREDDATKMWESEPEMYSVDKKLNDFDSSENIKYGYEFDNTNTMEIEYTTGNTVGAFNHIKINGKEIF